MSFLRHQQIYQSDVFFLVPGAKQSPASPQFIVLMSLPPAIPWRVALQHCPSPLHQPRPILQQTNATAKRLPSAEQHPFDQRPPSLIEFFVPNGASRVRRVEVVLNELDETTRSGLFKNQFLGDWLPRKVRFLVEAIRRKF
jgi:hypothetical protein